MIYPLHVPSVVYQELKSTPQEDTRSKAKNLYQETLTSLQSGSQEKISSMKTHEPIDYLRSSIPGSIRLKSRTSRIQRISRNNRNRLIPNGDGLISLENCVTISTQNSEACPVWSTVGPEQTEPFYLSGWDKKYDMSVCLATTKPDSQ